MSPAMLTNWNSDDDPQIAAMTVAEHSLLPVTPFGAGGYQRYAERAR
jgi:hypothetical protein